MDINLNYVHAEKMGYGRLGVKLAEALKAKGVTVYDHLPPPDGRQDDFGPQDRTPGVAGNACWVSTPPQAHGWWSGQTPSIFTMWETMRIPEDFRAKLHHFDTVMVPSDQNVELFSEYHPNVKRVLLGVDPAEWHYVERKPPGMFFDFLIGGSGARKGTDIAFEAFKAAFPASSVGADGPIPRLVMKNPKGEDFRFDGRVQVIRGKIPAEQEQALYASAHCYLQPSRGEGFGLQPLQALAQGLPTILTDAHGHESFAHLGYGVGAKPSKSAYFIYGDGGDWWEPSLDDLVDLMRWVYDNWGEACEKARVAASVIRETFTWEHTADQFLDAVDLRPLVDKGEWFEPDQLKFRIRLKGTRTYEIGGRRMTFQAGHDYWDTADVKRVIAENGHLHPDCIRAGEGLTDEQVQRLAGHDDHVYCPGCRQRYGSGMTKQDDLLMAEGDPDLTRWHAGA